MIFFLRSVLIGVAGKACSLFFLLDTLLVAYTLDLFAIVFLFHGGLVSFDIHE